MSYEQNILLTDFKCLQSCPIFFIMSNTICVAKLIPSGKNTLYTIP